MEKQEDRHKFRLSFILFCAILFLIACGGKQTIIIPTAQPTATVKPNLPEITSVKLDRIEVPKYESIELTLAVNAKYKNPYDARDVALQGVFTSPAGLSMTMPGFWDTNGAWKIRFTPSQEGTWTYAIFVTDARGASLPSKGEFTVMPSDLHGWIIPGNSFDPNYSGHYLVHHDGTPFYGVGHGDALNILIDGFDVETGVHLFDNMKAANENYVVWWPMYSDSLINSSYSDYSYAIGQLEV